MDKAKMLAPWSLGIVKFKRETGCVRGVNLPGLREYGRVRVTVELAGAVINCRRRSSGSWRGRGRRGHDGSGDFGGSNGTQRRYPLDMQRARPRLLYLLDDVL